MPPSAPSDATEMPRYHTTTPHRFFEVVAGLVGNEVQMGNTISFLGEVDMSRCDQLRAEAREAGRRKPSYTALMIKAVAGALQEFPYANRRRYRRPWLPFTRGRLQSFTTSDIAVAVERDIPGIEVATFIDVVRDADRLSLEEVTHRLHDLATCDEASNEQWRLFNGLIRTLPAWLSLVVISLPRWFPALWSRYRGGAVLVSSPAKYGVDAMIGAWTSPLGVSFGLVRDRAVVRAGQVVARPTMFFTLNWDRRVMAGAQAARFFHAIIQRLESMTGDEPGRCQTSRPADQTSAAAAMPGEPVLTADHQPH